MGKITTETQEEYRQRITKAICEAISNSDKSLWAICEKIEDAPKPSTVLRWLAADNGGELCDMYARAKERQGDYLAAQILELSDQCRMGTRTIDRDGKLEIVTADMVERSRLQIDARKWLAAKLAPRKYGDKLEVESKQSHAVTFTIVNYGDQDRLQDIGCTPAKAIDMAVPVEN